MIDVSTINPTCDALRRRASLARTYAAELRACDKHIKYDPAVSRWSGTFQCHSVVKTFGSTNQAAHKCLDDLATYKDVTTARPAHGARAAFSTGEGKRLAVAAQSAISFATDASLNKSRPRGDVAAYMQVHLLRTVAQPGSARALAYAESRR